MCECYGSGCPCGGDCAGQAFMILYRVDMRDEVGVAFCAVCAEDALSSGVFSEHGSYKAKVTQ